MPEAQLFAEFINCISDLWRDTVYVTPAIIKKIERPTLIAASELDACPIEHYLSFYHLLSKKQFAIIPGCDHLVFECKSLLITERIMSFLQ